MRKVVVVTGGVLSGLGKGVVAASVALLFQSKGYRVTLQKIDPYVNVDAGTMNPYEHGEVFVTEDGKETDLDIGRYERFLNRNLSAVNYVTTGQVYGNVIRQERAGTFLGETVQVIPHITDEIKRLIRLPFEEDDAEIGVIEVGGTVGDIEGLPYLEALRQMKDELPREDMCFVHVTLLPQLSTSDELKTKPTQHSVKELRGIGIQPHVVVARAQHPIPEPVRRKLALFCDVPLDSVIESIDRPSVYEVPLLLNRQGLEERIGEQLKLPSRDGDLRAWETLVHRVYNPSDRTTIAIVGKYVELHDAYISIREALVHAGAALDLGAELRWIPAERVATEGTACFDGVDGILVPGGFGDRGIEGKVDAVRHARLQGLPYFGICLGLQCAVIEIARDLLGLETANSSEFDERTRDPVIDLLDDQLAIKDRGGTMRRGAYPAHLVEGSIAHACYGTTRIEERHRHRYEFNPAYRQRFEAVGLAVTGCSPDGSLMEIVELSEHPWFVGVQFHPEFRSRFVAPHPLFRGFVQACVEHSISSS